MENHNEKTYEMKQYELCLEWFEFMTNDLFIGDKYSVQECNVILGQFMTTMERANQLDKTADDLLMEIIDLTNTQDLKVMQYLYLLAQARELRAWHEKLFG